MKHVQSVETNVASFLLLKIVIIFFSKRQEFFLGIYVTFFSKTDTYKVLSKF